jgi:hypothetical protein
MGLNRQIFLEYVLKLKHKLPLGGDWLFVTETPSSDDVLTQDLVMEYLNQEDVLFDLKTENENVVKLIYERALKYNKDVENISENIKKKAEILLRMTSFVSAIFFGILSFVSVSKNMNVPNWMLFLISIFFILMGVHLISSLVQAIKVMTREELVLSSPQQIVFKSNEDIQGNNENIVLHAYKMAISDIISNACNTHKLIRRSINKVIIAQYSFVYGLFFFMLIIGLQFSASFFQTKKLPEPSFSDLIQIEDQLLENIVKKEIKLREQIEDRKKIVEKLKIENEDILKQIILINKMLFQIEEKQNKVQKETNTPKE